ncbi:extracellular solute-binding protein [Wenjunlia tyrosinilytica]|uniref:ABC transporter substrate-binding protein n=1 Tax=Wenjunlia tyrosinilytica TaxID=1544741 RepID=A0A918DUX4_9ACTN|nr:extracellular solute-binding protein [Wenjunlia tyrosinilytica]GGO85228.1 hypothetical protein GCM10012280_18530 [Wenjunlia tyrosinilytica]
MLAAAGCAGQAPRADGAATEPILLASGSDLTSSGIRQSLIKQWNVEHPDHPARIVVLPDEADLQRSQLVGALQSGSGGYDVVNLDVTWTAEFAAGGLIQRWPEPLPADFIASVKNTVVHDGKVWGVPFNTDAALLYYNKEILDKYGFQAPRTWGQLMSVAEDIQDRHAESGYTAQLKEYEGLTVNVMEAIWASGGDLPAEDGNSGRIQEGLNNLKELYRQGMPDDSLTVDETASVTEFSGGKVAFMRNWPFAYNQLADRMPGFADKVVVTGLPGPSVLGGQNLAVTAHAGNPAWARRLIRYLTDRQSERCLLERGFAATRESAYLGNGGQICTRVPAPPDNGTPENGTPENGTPEGGSAGAGSTGAGSAGTGPAGEGRPSAQSALPADKYPLLLASIKRARARPVTPYYAAFTHSVQSTAATMLRNRITGNEAADTLMHRSARTLQGR